MVVHSNAVRVTWEAAPGHFFRGDAVALGFLSDGAGTTQFRLFGGALPPGLELSLDGKLEGTIAEDAQFGTYNFAVEGQDSIGARGLNSFALEESAPRLPPRAAAPPADLPAAWGSAPSRCWVWGRSPSGGVAARRSGSRAFGAAGLVQPAGLSTINRSSRSPSQACGSDKSASKP